jgi:hypothetical protein
MDITGIVLIIAIACAAMLVLRYFSGVIRGIIGVVAVIVCIYLLWHNVWDSTTVLGDNADNEFNRVVEGNQTISGVQDWIYDKWYDFKIWSGL